MSTLVAPLASSRSLPGRRYDRVFFPVMAVLTLATVFLGFAKTYFLAGMINAPLPSWIIHVHGALFSSWIILFIVQVSLVAAHRVDLHRKLGVIGFSLACVMIVFGLMAARNSLMRGISPVPTMDVRTFFVLPVAAMFVFATLIYFGYKFRKNSLAHKRIMMIATISLLGAAIARWPFAFVHNHVFADLTLYVFLLAMVVYDLWSTHKVQRATLYASLFVIVVQQVSVPLAMTQPWIHFADFIAGKS